MDIANDLLFLIYSSLAIEILFLSQDLDTKDELLV